MYLRKQNTHRCTEDYLPLISDKPLNNAQTPTLAMLHFQRPLKITKNRGALSEFLLYWNTLRQKLFSSNLLVNQKTLCNSTKNYTTKIYMQYFLGYG